MGLFAPFAAGIARRFGTARAVGGALGLVALFGALRVLVPDAWEILLLTVPVGIGMGIVAYAVAVAFYTLLAIWRMRRAARRDAQRSQTA